MRRLRLSEARRRLPSLVREVERSGRAVVLTRHNRPVAVLSTCVGLDLDTDAPKLPLRGLSLGIRADFDEPLADDWKAFRR